VGKTHANPLKIRGALAFYQSPLLDASMSHLWQKLALIPSTCWFYQQKIIHSISLPPVHSQISK